MKNIKNGYVSKYLDDSFLFIRTLVFKLADLASLMNEEVVRVHGTTAVDIDHPETWKYYLNISGEYHPTDELMRVVSIDTLNEIVFTKDNLKIHTATADAYSYGTRDYYALVSKYPKQVRLINGILNPADLQTAINCKDGTILAYRKDLVEVNEITLIEDLQREIEKLLFRWYNTQFNISSPLYASTFLTQLYMQLLTKFINLRWHRCHTSEVHSFHIRMFLASHAELDRYLPYLNLKQMLWLYRNMRYIERNAGRSEQFQILIDRLLTSRQIPLGGYTVRQTDDFVDYQPTVVARLDPLNPQVNAFHDKVQAVTEVYDRERLMTPGNARYLDQSQEKSIDLLRRGPSTAIQTKVLHSSMTDLSNAVPETFEEVAVRQWCYMANNGLYDAYVTFKDPKSSVVYSLKAEDAFIYMYYISLMMIGIDVKIVPNYLNMRQRKHPKPSLSDLMSVVDTEKHDLESIAINLLANQPPLITCYSVSSFNTLATAIYQECYRHWFIISSTEDYYERALVDNMVNQLFEDERIQLNFNAANMDAWLFEKNLPRYDYEYTEAASLMIAIYRAATGVKDNIYGRLSNVQKAMLSLTEELSSYSIQFTREINETDMVLLNWPAVRLGDVSLGQADTRYVDSEVLVDGIGGEGTVNQYLTADEDQTAIQAQQAQSNLLITMDVVPEQWLDSTFETSVDDTATATVPDITYEGQDEALDALYGINGYTLLNSLTEDQFASLKSIY